MELTGKRLRLVPCTADIARGILAGDREKLSRLLGAAVQDEWPTQDTRDVAPFVLADLEADEASLGWGMWIAIDALERVVVGDMGFKGKPDETGTVEIGYGIIPSRQGLGLATEGVRLLIGWAFSHSEVNRVTAECLNDNLPSVRVLEKLGMRQTVSDGRMIRWELIRSS